MLSVKCAVAMALGAVSFGVTAHASADPPRVADKRIDFATFLYVDDVGLTVATEAVVATMRVGNLELTGDFLLDRVHQAAVDPHHGLAIAEANVDVVSSASGRDVFGDRTRVEGSLGGRYSFSSIDLGVRARVSAEPGYLSGSGSIALTAPFAGSGTELSVRGSYGHDVATSLTPESDASSVRDRVGLDLGLTHLFTSRLSASIGLGGVALFGQLSTPDAFAPYRSITLPEAMPSDRIRGSAFARTSAYIFDATAVHIGLAGYADTWAILAFAPEARIARDFGDRLTLALSYRFYWQTPAAFYEVVYLEKTAYRSADARLGAITEHRPSASFEWRLGGAFDTTLRAGYTLSNLEHRSMRHQMWGHLSMLGISLGQ